MLYRLVRPVLTMTEKAGLVVCIRSVVHRTSFLSIDSVTSSHLFCLARVVYRHVFEELSKFAGKLEYLRFELYFILKFIYCIPYIPWPLQDKNKAVVGILWPVLMNIPNVLETKAWVVICVLKKDSRFQCPFC